MNFADCVDEIFQALERPVKFTALPLDNYIDALQQQGVPDNMQ